MIKSLMVWLSNILGYVHAEMNKWLAIKSLIQLINMSTKTKTYKGHEYAQQCGSTGLIQCNFLKGVTTSLVIPHGYTPTTYIACFWEKRLIVFDKDIKLCSVTNFLYDWMFVDFCQFCVWSSRTNRLKNSSWPSFHWDIAINRGQLVSNE